MKKTIFTRYRLFAMALMMTVVFTGCVGSRMGVSWPSLGTVIVNGEEQIIVSFTDAMDIVSPINGAAARLVNPSTGEVRRLENGDPRTWKLSGGENDGAQFYVNPIQLGDDTLLVADYNRRLLEVDMVSASVNEVISSLQDHVLADMLLVDDVLYVPFQSGDISALPIDGGDPLWTFDTNEGVWSKPILVDDMIVFTSLNHNMYAVNAETGEEIWRVDLEGGVSSSPLLYNDHLYIGSYAKKVFEVSLDGEILNIFDTQNWVWSTPAVDSEGIIYVADLSGYVHALDTNDSLSPVWSTKVATRGIRPSPVVYEDNIIVASRDGIIYWLDMRDGVTLFDQEVEGRPELLGDLLLLEPNESLGIDEPLIVVSTENTGALLVAFELDGRQTWVYGR